MSEAFDDWGDMAINTAAFDPGVIRPTEYDTLRINVGGKMPGFRRIVVCDGTRTVELSADEFIYALKTISEAREGDAPRLRERTCRLLGSFRHDYEDGYAGTEWEHELSCGHETWWSSDEPPEWCPWCGSKVVE